MVLTRIRPQREAQPQQPPHVAKVMAYLPDAIYPAVREQLVEWARDRAAPQGVLLLLEALPDRRFDHEAQVAAVLQRLPVDPRDVFELPLPHYDDMALEEITVALDSLTPQQVRTIVEYERYHKQRRAVLNACEMWLCADAETAAGPGRHGRGVKPQTT